MVNNHHELRLLYMYNSSSPCVSYGENFTQPCPSFARFDGDLNIHRASQSSTSLKDHYTQAPMIFFPYKIRKIFPNSDNEKMEGEDWAMRV